MMKVNYDKPLSGRDSGRMWGGGGRGGSDGGRGRLKGCSDPNFLCSV